jgi:hypothetical protein
MVRHEATTTNAVFSLSLSLSLSPVGRRLAQCVRARVSSIDFSPQRVPSRSRVIIGAYRVSRTQRFSLDLFHIFFFFLPPIARETTLQYNSAHAQELCCPLFRAYRYASDFHNAPLDSRTRVLLL